MAKGGAVAFRNISMSTLYLPDGTDIPPQKDAEISAEMLENEGVKTWIAEGMLSRKASSAKPA